MFKGFKEFVMKHQVLGLAVAVIIGGAVGKVVSSLVADILMPLISPLIGKGDWRSAAIVLSRGGNGEVLNSVKLGSFLGTVVDFVIISFCIYMIVKVFEKKETPAPAPPIKDCPDCVESVHAAARVCKFCGHKFA
jgi:large conductance mechanosensitive channel